MPDSESQSPSGPQSLRDLLLESLADPALRRLTLASPPPSAPWRRLRVRPVQLQAGARLQFAWFDGRRGTGEIGPAGVLIEETGEPDRWRATYDVVFPGERRIHQEVFDAGALPPQLRAGLELAGRQQTEAAGAIDRLDRLPVPFAVEGGAGPSGVDLYPELRPIELPGEDLRLYQ